jgi:hypothetical protein
MLIYEFSEMHKRENSFSLYIFFEASEYHWYAFSHAALTVKHL